MRDRKDKLSASVPSSAFVTIEEFSQMGSIEKWMLYRRDPGLYEFLKRMQCNDDSRRNSRRKAKT